ncbi:MAG: aminoacyl--tRNA ligase-related protein [Patescibacteria group bacterium]|nr:prolyl-tRNA synthetase [Patescibacteria group bacterium]
MLQSKLLVKTSKTPPKDEISLNAKLLIRAGFVDKLMAGVYSLTPLGFRVFKKIENIIRQEMNKIHGQELLLPSLHPQKNWEKTGRWKQMDDLFKIPLNERKNFALGPTHEEVITPLAQKFISSYKDLPQYVYQFQNKFRLEKRAKSGLLRCLEFVMKDLYSFHATQKSLDQFYEQVKKAYQNIFTRCGLGDITYLTYASGGTFSKYSHEFQTLTQSGEDHIYLCPECQIAINQEIIKEQKKSCPQCQNSQLEKKKAVEVGNIFKLGTRFSQAFGLRFSAKDGRIKPVIMGCYGIGLQRVMGAVVETQNDSRGIIWPEEIAPFKVHIIQLEDKDQNVKEQARTLYDLTKKEKIPTLLDDRKDKKPGEKFADADLFGIPLRVVVSQNTSRQKKYELKHRNKEKKILLSQQQLLKIIKR